MANLGVDFVKNKEDVCKLVGEVVEAKITEIGAVLVKNDEII